MNTKQIRLTTTAYKGWKTAEWNRVKWGNFRKFVETFRFCLKFDTNDVSRPAFGDELKA
jgi:hypothetical protein